MGAPIPRLSPSPQDFKVNRRWVIEDACSQFNFCREYAEAWICSNKSMKEIGVEMGDLLYMRAHPESVRDEKPTTTKKTRRRIRVEELT